jgi:lipid II isoglutaminyl synthase (glutamine-hydrolysing)
MHLKLAHLYAQAMNIYGDRGNVLTLLRRAQWRGITVELQAIEAGETQAGWEDHDLYFMGGGQDAQQLAIQQDLLSHKKAPLTHAAANGAVFLTICGGYQLLGHYYKPHNSPELKGLSLIDAYTVAGSTRFIGNVVAQRPSGEPLVGFENHSGLTYLGKEVQPLAKVAHGHGNNGKDGFEGAKVGKLYGTYLHGSLLPKNPQLADELLLSALQRRYDLKELPPFMEGVNDTLEQQAHNKALTFAS